MHIWFDMDFDSNAWPGALAGREAAAGEAWLGPLGLLNLLELQLGLTGPEEGDGTRAAALVPCIREINGFWSASAQVDPIGVARTLLRWRDELWTAGWCGQNVSPRLGQLAELTRDMSPGLPDRLLAVASQLGKRTVELRALTLLEPIEALPSLWRAVMGRLREQGVELNLQLLSPVPARGDLAAAKTGRFAPAGDGTLQLLRPQGPHAAAEEVAAWLAGGCWHDTVVIGPEPLLDLALRRHGLPTLGSVSRTASNALLEILPLVIALGWSPPDPQRALELLTLPISPVPRGIASRLVQALQQWPALDSDAWRQALAGGLDAIGNKEDRQRLQDRLDVLLRPAAKAANYPAGGISRRIDMLHHWLRGRLEMEEGAHVPWEAALGQCLALQRLVQLTGLSSFSRPQLQRLIEQATAGVAGLALHPPQARLHAVPCPGAIAGAAKQVVWWDFSRNQAGAVEQLPMQAVERRALADIGVHLPQPAVLAQSINARWGRPLLCAEERILLVCPRYGNDGAEQHPHPLWDEIIANLAKSASASMLVVDRPIFAQPPKLIAPAMLARPAGRGCWTLPKGFKMQRREAESPTGAGSLLACPFKWVLQYLGGIHDGQVTALPDVKRLVGNVAHELLARLLRQGPLKPAQAEEQAIQLFDTEGPRLAALLFMPGNEPLKASSRAMTGRAARVLFAHLHEAKLGIVAVEEPRSAKALGSALEGRADLVAGPPSVVIDLKSGGDKYRRAELENGAAYQLSCYSRLHRNGTAMPPVAFYILETQRLLTTHRGLFPSATFVEGAAPEETWLAFERSYAARWKELSVGTVAAPGEKNEGGELNPAQSTLVDGELRLTPPCRFCNYYIAAEVVQHLHLTVIA